MRRSFAVRFATLVIPMVVLVPCAPALGDAAGARSAAATVASNHSSLCPHTGILPTRSNLELVNMSIRCLIDRERTSRGLHPLHTNRDLQRLATTQAKDMVIGEYFGDDSLGGKTPWQRVTKSAYAAKAKSLSLGQNIGWGTGSLATPSAMVSAWMRSPEHRRITLTAGYQDIGVGIAPAPPISQEGIAEGATYTVEFAARD
jgi:uncharacterized protein YkwD